MNDPMKPDEDTPKDDEFERMLEQMEEELSGDDEPDDPTLDEEEDSDELALVTSSLDPDLEPTVVERRDLRVDPDDDLSLNFAVQVTAGDGTFHATEATGLLAGSRCYKVTVLDDFSFGADALRNNYEIILDPNAAAVSLQDVPAGTQWDLRCDEQGRVVMDKPVGVRIAVHAISRKSDGTQSVSQVAEAGPEGAGLVALPITEASGGHAEFMVGIGVAETDPPSYAFSVYLAVKIPG